MNKETVKEAAEQYAQGNSLEFAYLQEIPAFKAGVEWQKEQSGKQWTDEDMLNAFKAGTDNETLVETGIGMYPNHQYNPEEWLKLYKQSKSNADN